MAIFSNGMLLRRKKFDPPTLTLMTAITTVASGSTFTVPATAQAGDIALFFQFARASSGTPAAVTITGATVVGNQVAGASSQIRAMLSYKILDAADIGATRTSMNGSSGQNYNTVRIIRPSGPISSLVIGSPASQWNNGSFSQTIAAPPDTPAFIVGRLFNQQSAVNASGTLFTTGNRLNESGGTNYATLVEIQNTAPASRTMGTTATTGIIVGQSFYGIVT